MKKIVLVLSFLSIISLSVSAQSKGISIGARGGLSIPKITASGDNPMSQGYSSRLAGGAGIFAEFHFTDCFSLQPMIEYSGQGGKRDGMQAIPPRMIPDQFKPYIPAGIDYLYADFDSETKFDYLMVPVLAKFGWNLGETSPFRVYVSGGPFVSFLMGATQETSGSSSIYLDKAGQQPLPVGKQDFGRDDNIKSQMNTVNCGLSGNVGLAYRFGRSSVFIEGGGNYGFLKLQKDEANGNNRIGVGTVMLGYSYRLK